MTSDARDREIEQVVDYLAGALTPEQAGEVRRRLDGDPAFAARMRPYVAAWTMEPTRGPGRRGGDTRAAWLAVRDAIQRAREAEAGSAMAVTLDDVVAPTTHQLRGQRSRYRMVLVPAARAAVLVVAAIVTWAFYLMAGPAWVRGHVASAWDALPWAGAIDQVSAHGRHRVVTLPDGTRVDMDGMSWVRYSNDESKGRSVYLEGRATFVPAVVPNSRFMVRTGTASIAADDGEFTVDGRKTGRIRVSVARGAVTVWPAGPSARAATTVGAGGVADVTADTVRVGATSTP